MPFEDTKAKNSADTDQLLRSLVQEESMSLAYMQSETETAMVDALKRYFGDKYGDEVPDRSQVTTREVFEVIEWLRPDLTRVIMAGENVVELHPISPDDDEYAKAASDVVAYAFSEDNPGHRLVDEFVFDGLLQRRGFIACDWQEADYAAPENVTGLNSLQVQALQQDQTCQLEITNTRHDYQDEQHPDGLCYDATIRQLTKPAKAEVFTIAPEDMRIAARAVEIENVRYIGDVIRMMRGEAKVKWPKFKAEIDAFNGASNTLDSDERRSARFRDLDSSSWSDRGDSGGDANEIEILREYIRYDLDGDDYPELYRCFRLGETLLEHEEVEDHIYASWTPIPIPHRFWGLSMNDIAKDLQRTKTVLLRGMLDSVYLSVTPRIAADEQGVNLDDLLTVRPGAVIRTQGDPAGKLMPLVTPDLSASALAAMQWVDRIGESRTGVNRSAQPMDPDLLHDTAKGVELLQNAASIRKEQIARNLADGMEQLFRKLYRLLCKNQDARMMKINGAWTNVDPRSWNADLRVTVHTGLGTGAKDQHLAMLQMIQNDQMAYVANYGPDTPIVTPSHMLNVETAKLRVMGFKSKDQFFGDPKNPDGTPFTPPPKPDPNQAKAQMDMQIASMEMQGKNQLEQLKMQQDDKHEQMQFAKDTQLATIQASDNMARAQNDGKKNMADAVNTAAQIELDGEKLKHEQTKTQIEAAIKQTELELKKLELELKAREAEAGRQHERDMADRQHQHAIAQIKAQPKPEPAHA